MLQVETRSQAHLLAPFFHHRWTASLLAELERAEGARFVELVHRLGVSRGGLRAALDRAIARDWVCRNPGYGHPLRPEYLPTDTGSRLGRAARPLLVAIRRQGLNEIARHKWTMPVLLAVAGGAARFGEIKAVLGSITDRALAQALRDLIAVGLVRRRVLDTHPPASRYVRCRRGAALVRALRTLARELSKS